jgi:CRP-like cAMP-binding protein
VNILWGNIFRKKLEEESLAFFLGAVPVFAELGKRSRIQLETLVHVRTYKANETIFETGDPGSGMYVIRSGAVQVFERSPAGTEREVARLGPKDFFGESTLVVPAKRTASARTLEPTVLVGLFRADITDLAKRRPGAAYRILLCIAKIVSERLHVADYELLRLRQKHPEYFEDFRS